MVLTQDKILTAMELKTAEDLIAFANENGFILTTDEAEAYLSEFKDCELSEHEMESVTGFTEACRDCYKNKRCTGDSTCGGGRYRYPFLELEETVA